MANPISGYNELKKRDNEVFIDNLNTLDIQAQNSCPETAVPDFGAYFGEISKYSSFAIEKQKIEKWTKGNRYTLVRKSEVKAGKDFSIQPAPDNVVSGVDLNKKTFRMFAITLVGKGRAHSFSTHDGEDFILVQEGSIKIILDNKEEVLEEGDSIYYCSTIPHRIENLNIEKSVILAVIYFK